MPPQHPQRRPRSLRLRQRHQPADQQAAFEALMAREGVTPADLVLYGAVVTRDGTPLLETHHQVRSAGLALQHALQARRVTSLEASVAELAARLEVLRAPHDEPA